MPRGVFDRSRRNAASRRRLLDAAARVYAAHGFNGATLDDVAEEAGLTKGAIYSHFGSKFSLMVALMEEYLAVELAGQIIRFPSDDATSKESWSCSYRWIEKLDESADALRLLVEFWLAAGRDERLHERFVGVLEAMRLRLSEFATNGPIDSGTPATPASARDFANVALGLSLGLGIVRIADRGSVSPALLASALSVLSVGVPAEKG